MAVVGLLQMAYLFKKEYMKPNEFSLAFGVLYVTSLIFATKPDVIIDNYPLVLSGVVVLDSTLRLQYYYEFIWIGKRSMENQCDFGGGTIGFRCSVDSCTDVRRFHA